MDRDRLLDLRQPEVPDGESPWREGFGPGRDLTIAPPDPRWADDFTWLRDLVAGALGSTALSIEHVGSTSVPDLAAKPIVDVCVVVPDPDDEAAYAPALQAAGLDWAVREPWWEGHRLFRSAVPRANVHVFGPESAEPVRMRIFRDWLRAHPDDRARYEASKRAAAVGGGHVMEYNARKQEVLRAILVRAVTDWREPGS